MVCRWAPSPRAISSEAPHLPPPRRCLFIRLSVFSGFYFLPTNTTSLSNSSQNSPAQPSQNTRILCPWKRGPGGSSGLVFLPFLSSNEHSPGSVSVFPPHPRVGCFCGGPRAWQVNLPRRCPHGRSGQLGRVPRRPWRHPPDPSPTLLPGPSPPRPSERSRGR